MNSPSFKKHTTTFLKNFRRKLSNENALLPLSLLGIFTGLLAGTVIQAFRLLIELPGGLWLPRGHEDYESLSPYMRLAIASCGAMSLGLFTQFILRHEPKIGLAHVVYRMNVHHGRLPLRPAALQFLLGLWSILTGQSSGREGPAIHLGAAASSYVGQYWKLPSNSIRVLTGCGAAAAIAASFNTPIAGVIFAMEVIMMEYTIAGFIPIMLAASAGTAISQVIYGDAPAFMAINLNPHSISEIPAFIGLGLCIGIVAAIFCFIHRQGLRLQRIPLWIRFTIAGTMTGTLAMYIPEVMGIGYDTLDLALDAQLGFYLLIAICTAKLIATAMSSSLGMPIGIIGPTLLIGGCFGGAVGIIINYLAPQHIANDSFYVMLGMGAMMGAVMNAPLAALIALLELTHTPYIILPAMITIVIATLTNTQIFKQTPPHQSSLKNSGKHAQLSMFEIALQRIGVTSLMNANVKTCQRYVSKQALLGMISTKPRWLIVETENNSHILLNGPRLEKAYNETEELHDQEDDSPIDILSLPGEHQSLALMEHQASALEAWQIMDKEDVNAVYIIGAFDAYAPAISGIITRHDLDDYYHRPRNF